MAAWVKEEKKPSEHRQRKREAEEADKVEVAPVVVVVVVSHIQRIGCQPEKTTIHGGQSRSWSAEHGGGGGWQRGVTVVSLRRFRAALIGPTQGLPKRRRLCL